METMNKATLTAKRAELVAEYKRLSRSMANELQQEWMSSSLRLERDKVQDEINAIDCGFRTDVSEFRRDVANDASRKNAASTVVSS